MLAEDSGHDQALAQVLYWSTICLAQLKFLEDTSCFCLQACKQDHCKIVTIVKYWYCAFRLDTYATVKIISGLAYTYVLHYRPWERTIHSGVPHDMQLLVLLTRLGFPFGCTTLTMLPPLIPGRPSKVFVLHTSVSNLSIIMCYIMCQCS